MKKSIIIVGVVIIGAILYHELQSTPTPTPSVQIVPIGQQPKDPTKPWCYEQKSGENTVVVCG